MSACTNFNSSFVKCIINTLLNMAVAALEAFKAWLIAQSTVLDAYIAYLMMQALQYNVLGMLMKKAADVARALFEKALQALAGLPLNQIDPNCLEWAGIMGNLNELIDNEIRPPFERILEELERLTSFQDELEALKKQYEELKQLILDLIDLLEAVILEAKCRKAASAGNQFVV